MIFLDVITKVDKDNQEIYSTLYTKPTDNHGYLDYESCHLIHNKMSIPYSQFLRLKRNCSYWHDFTINSIKLATHFSLRGYPDDLVRNSLLKVSRMSRTQVLHKQSISTSASENNIFCILDYNPNDPDVRSTLLHHWDIVDRSSSTRMLHSLQLIVGYQRPKSLMDILCRSDVRLASQDPIKNRNRAPLCLNILRCKNCKNLNKSGSIISHSTGRKYKCIKKCTCRSKNLIYCIQCRLCQIQYVGQTKNELRQRLNGHLSTIRTGKDTPVVRHFAQHNVINNPSMDIYVLQLIREHDEDSGKKLRDL